jgi:hypothetical protein
VLRNKQWPPSFRRLLGAAIKLAAGDGLVAGSSSLAFGAGQLMEQWHRIQTADRLALFRFVWLQQGPWSRWCSKLSSSFNKTAVRSSPQTPRRYQAAPTGKPDRLEGPQAIPSSKRVWFHPKHSSTAMGQLVHGSGIQFAGRRLVHPVPSPWAWWRLYHAGWLRAHRRM